MPKLYKLESDTFVEVGYEFTGFPSNGMWFVEDGKQNCIIPMGDKPTKPTPTLVSYMILQDELQKTISKAWEDKALSVRDISYIACEFFAMKAGAIKIKDEIIEN